MSTRAKSGDKRLRIVSRNERRTQKYRDDEQALAIQPTILRKPEQLKLETKADDAETAEAPEVFKKSEVPVMRSSETLISRNHLDPSSLLKFLDLDNSSFYVIGVIGMKSSGKSTLLSLIATGELHQCSAKKVNAAPMLGEFPKGNGIEAFITSNRVFLLDSAPILHNTTGREFIISEADDIRQIQAMFRLCHELHIVYEGHQIMNLTRMITCAKNMMKPYEYNEPQIVLVENRSQPRSAKSPMTEIAKNLLTRSGISDSISTIQLPDFNRLASHHEDPLDIISELRDNINTRKELKAIEDSSDTEKSWWEKFNKMRMEGGYFLKEYESLRDKYYQANENLSSHP